MSSYENPAVRVLLKKERDKSVKNYHPWIFSGAIAGVTGGYIPGDIVPVYSHSGEFLAKGFINPHSQIRIRILTFKDEPIDDHFFLHRLRKAQLLRTTEISGLTTAYRAVHGDGDYLPGLVIDVYNDICVVQVYSHGMENLRNPLLEWLKTVFSPAGIVERSEGSSRKEEGLALRKELILGKIDPRLIIEENGIRYYVDLLKGQKTGFFLDQRDNRARIGQLSAGKSLLNCFSYTGGFSLAAAVNGAVTTSVEISQNAQDLAIANFGLNQLDPSAHSFRVKSAFDFFYDTKDSFEVIVLDPPAFVKRRSQVNKGSRAYKEINRLAFNALSPQGHLLTCSCSAHVSWDLFQKIIFAAAQESGKNVQIIGRYGQPSDHPVNIYHPEGEYLKTFLLRTP